jgi:hypothetical protein
VRWITDASNGLPPIKRIFVHSLNTPAALRMRDNLQKAGYKAEYVPFYNLIEELYATVLNDDSLYV